MPANGTAKKAPPKPRFPRWAPYAAAITLSVLIVLTMNFRAFTEYASESDRHDELNKRIEELTDENLQLQEEIHYLKTDPKTVEREARKFGLRPKPEDKVSESGKIDNAEKSTSRNNHQ